MFNIYSTPNKSKRRKKDINQTIRIDQKQTHSKSSLRSMRRQKNRVKKKDNNELSNAHKMDIMYNKSRIRKLISRNQIKKTDEESNINIKQNYINIQPIDSTKRSFYSLKSIMKSK